MPHRLIIIALLPAMLVGFGTLGYRLIEGWPWFDALYMTVITLTTVGFLEVHPLDRAGRAFTMVIALGGIFTVFYAASEVLRAYATGELGTLWKRRSMQSKLAALSDHVIVCGFGSMGRLVAQEFSESGTPFVVVERDPAVVERFDMQNGLALIGDATSDDVLRQAGIARARALVAVIAGDADNLLITMSARLLNDRVMIVARAEEEGTARKLERAGANRVITPNHLGSLRVAQAVLRPAVVDFIELATRTGHVELQLEELRVKPGTPFAGRRLEEVGLRKDLGLVVVGLKRADGTMLFNPEDDVRLDGGDRLVVIGPRERLDRAERAVRG